MATKKKPAAKAAADQKLGEILAGLPTAPGPKTKDPMAAYIGPLPTAHQPGEVGGPPVVASSPMGMESGRPLPLDEAEAAIIQQLNDMAADAERLGRAVLVMTVANKYKSTFDIAANAAVRRIKAAIAVIG